jgi:peptidoglycan hydrolase-like protein with peptidoglycan-binding domain
METAKPAAKAAAPAKKAKKAKKKSAKKIAKKKAVKASPTVKKAQMALAKAGFKTKADGYMGKNTRTAIKGYQKKKGLKVSGKLDKSTQKSLGI